MDQDPPAIYPVYHGDLSDPQGPALNEDHPHYWAYGINAGGYQLDFGMRRGQLIRDTEWSYLMWGARDATNQPEFQDAVAIYAEGAPAFAKKYCRDFVVPFGTYRGRRLREAREGWMHWVCYKARDEPNWKRKHSLFFIALDEYLWVVYRTTFDWDAVLGPTGNSQAFASSALEIIEDDEIKDWVQEEKKIIGEVRLSKLSGPLRALPRVEHVASDNEFSGATEAARPEEFESDAEAGLDETRVYPSPPPTAPRKFKREESLCILSESVEGAASDTDSDSESSAAESTPSHPKMSMRRSTLSQSASSALITPSRKRGASDMYPTPQTMGRAVESSLRRDSSEPDDDTLPQLKKRKLKKQAETRKRDDTTAKNSRPRKGVHAGS